jgi:hypothetical protein
MAVTIGANGGNFLGNESTISANQTLTTAYNWLTVGPMTINNGITVTINSGATWVVV